MTFDAQFAGDVPPERLGGFIVPAGWDHMILYVRPGDEMMLDVYDPPASLRSEVEAGSFIDGVYLVSFTRGLKLYQSSRTTPTSGPDGLFAADDTILLKINYQWDERGGTNTDLVFNGTFFNNSACE